MVTSTREPILTALKLWACNSVALSRHMAMMVLFIGINLALSVLREAFKGAAHTVWGAFFAGDKFVGILISHKLLCLVIPS